MSAPQTLLGLYRPGTTPLHRAPVGAKLLGLAVMGVVVVVLRGPVSGLALLALAVALACVSRTGTRRTLRALRPILLVAVVLGGIQLWRLGPLVAVEVVADLLSLVLAATVVTATTPTDATVDAIARACGPLRRFGVSPERVAFAMALTIRAIPQVLEVAVETRQAAKARGLERDPRALLVPMVVRTVGRARTTGDALAARGLGDD
ncbi:energy-coupling factor transporter transmembrane component T family protein [Solicola sp. PLA-1-18]|uniref:energy-coupling factor transporter transmembrane component T family protein n=1 Tax=Solicola sp. PLA-1-18 TaxID=3380532 RepID=UPI003B7F6E6A